jgi:hypothetical protein
MPRRSTKRLTFAFACGAGVWSGFETGLRFGETHLLVPTGAGVREPQNRRVEIIIR